MSDPIRLNRFLAQHGICSRRQADDLIATGQVLVNGVRAVTGMLVSDQDLVVCQGKRVQDTVPRVYLKLHKPPGITCTGERSDPNNVIDYVGHPQRVFYVGRLDKFSTGLLLLTNDGDIVNPMLRAMYGHEKEYIVKVDRAFDRIFLERMARGVILDQVRTLPCEVSRLGSRSLRIILKEGRNRQIRRMVQALGYRVTSLVRTRVMHIHLGDLPEGSWCELTKNERETLLARVEEIMSLPDQVVPDDVD